MRILVADDNPGAAGVLADFFTLVGHEVQLASDGEAALTIARAFKPDLAFLDIEMPKLDGFQLAQRLRAEESQTTLILAAITGLTGAEERARQAGFDHFLTKPIRLHVLDGIVRKAMCAVT